MRSIQSRKHYTSSLVESKITGDRSIDLSDRHELSESKCSDNVSNARESQGPRKPGGGAGEYTGDEKETDRTDD